MQTRKFRRRCRKYMLAYHCLSMESSEENGSESPGCVTYNKIEALVKNTYKEESAAAKLNVSDFVKIAKVDKAFIIHDKADRIIDISQAQDVYNNWPQCEMLEIEGTGHFRILRTDWVIDKVIDFLND